MEDNGLLKYYRDKQNVKNGFLNFEKVEDFSSAKLIPNCNDHENVFMAIMKNKNYFIKYPRFLGEIDSEVLLSQVYHKAGVPSAIYTPIQGKLVEEFGNEKMVVSNSVISSPEDLIAKEYFFDSQALSMENPEPKKFFPHTKPSGKLEVEKYFELKAIKEIVLKNALDLASINFDGSFENFALNFKNGKVSHILSFDKGISFDAVKSFNITKKDFLSDSPQSNEITRCCNLGQEEYCSGKDVLNELKTNETVNYFITPSEIAQTIGNINIPDIAKDIKETIGYKIDKDYVEVLESSFNYVAEELSK